MWKGGGGGWINTLPPTPYLWSHSPVHVSSLETNIVLVQEIIVIDCATFSQQCLTEVLVVVVSRNGNIRLSHIFTFILKGRV